MSGIRAVQKEKTRRALIDAAFNQLSAEKSFSNISLREVAREAGIAPTSFYRHFRDMDELGLTMVDEAGLTLRQLMRQARKRIEKGGSVIAISVETFFEFITQSPNVFRLLLRESSGTSLAFRTAAAREIKHFTDELAEYIMHKDRLREDVAYVQAEGMVTLVFASGSNALDMSNKERELLKGRLIKQLRMLTNGAYLWRENNYESKESKEK
ncbi:TetR family transcriptional regulator [Cricetibacter osteomyelitidis]|uniref:TetR family transcriptional regulator n=1 Tax=Cricetibacter osteomyelitidis TaxID=1521931 RepID=A0A4R2SX00_9PAST|nr:HTH-type transcriptional repressor FabR [Cricetibacter osteomyelitidis]TCP95017.1 TetR family transcriptional regulator [Cricetibacter osteomyelitidis]